MLTDAIKSQFEELASALEPENLSCDGECSGSRIKAKLSHLRAEWRKLEKQVGRSVSENEVWDWTWKRLETV